jgi:CubicO group peptidase (beta-lactamase class C family)
MDYKQKYIKYKQKYLSAKMIQHGGKIKLDEKNSEIIQITTNKELKKYKEKLIELTKICEPTDTNFEPTIQEDYDIFWIIKHNDGDIVGYLKSQDLKQFEENKYFEILGGIKGKRGLQIGGACNGIPEKYSNLATPLLKKIEEYAKEKKYDYIVLHAGTDRDYLISENPERQGLYIKNGYIKERILKAGEGDFADIDLWIMRKNLKNELNQMDGKNTKKQVSSKSKIKTKRKLNNQLDGIKIDKYILNINEKVNIPGLTLVLLNKNLNKTLYFGYNDNDKKLSITENTIYLSASLSKPVFSYGVLKLVESGGLDLDKPLYKYISQTKIDKTLKKDERYKKITARMVLSHTSGLQNDGSNIILNDPGSKFLYSGDGFLYLQHSIEIITGLHINDFMSQYVFIPLNMNHSSYIYKKEYDNYLIIPHDQFGNIKNWKNMNMFIKNENARGHVAGGLFTTAQDYCNFILGLNKDKEIKKKMLKEQIKLTDNIYWGLGIGIEIKESYKIMWHWGDNLYMRHYMLYNFQKQEGFILFTNSFHGLSIIDDLTKLLYGYKFKSVLLLKDLTENRFLHEQYDNPLRISRHNVLNTFLLNGMDKGMEKYKIWINKLNIINKDQINALIEEFNTWLYKENEKYVKAIKLYNSKHIFKFNMDKLIKQLNSNYGIVISNNNKIIYEKYVGNNENTRFRVFSCSKPITAMAIFLLAQENKLKLTDTIDKFCINIPYSNKITINHLLNHTSGVYDFSSELYFKLNPKKIFDEILEKNETKFIDFETTITEMNKNKPYFKPQKNPFLVDLKNYNNTGYDLLGYIIYRVSGIKTDEFIRQNIFKPLKMNDSGFQHDKHNNESMPYEDNKKQGIKEQQNWFCGNAYVVCTLRDYNKFLSGYEKLLNKEYLDIYQKLYYFGKTTKNNEKYSRFGHEGGGDFNHLHSLNKEEYYPLSRTMMVKFYNKTNKINIIMSENYQNTNGFFTDNYKNWNYMIDNIIEF